MPPKKETPEQKANRLTQQGEAILAQADYHEITAIMKSQPETIPMLRTFLTQKGKWGMAKTEFKVEQQAKVVPTMTAEQEVANQAALAAALANYPELKNDLSLQMEIHRNFTNWRASQPNA
jgi:hypothetical protein